MLTSEIQLKATENFYLPVTIGKNVIREYQKEEMVYTKAEAEAKAQEELSLFFEKLRIKGLQIIEKNILEKELILVIIYQSPTNAYI